MLLADGTLEHGPHHADPQCQHFSTCGGCQLQQLDEESLAAGAVVEQQHAAKARSNLTGAIEAARQAGVSCEPLVMQSRLPCDEIVAVARRANCDAIFMATRGKMGLLDQLFDESTTRQVLQKTTVPVLVFP